MKPDEMREKIVKDLFNKYGNCVIKETTIKHILDDAEYIFSQHKTMNEEEIEAIIWDTKTRFVMHRDDIKEIARALSGRLPKPKEECNHEWELTSECMINRNYPPSYKCKKCGEYKPLPPVKKEIEALGEQTQFWCKGYDPLWETIFKLWDKVEQLIQAINDLRKEQGR